MANFIGTKFQFNGGTSDSHNVILVKVGDAGMIPTSIGGGRSPVEEWIVNRDKPFFYRAKMEPRQLEITITLNTAATPTLTWDSSTRADVFAWLYGPRTYCDFTSEDSNYAVIDKIIFTNPLELTTADLDNGFITLSAIALPHRYSAVQTTTVVVASTPVTTTINCLQNVMNPNGEAYFYPQLVSTVGAGATTVSITNVTDSNRLFELTGVSAGEVITAVNDLKILSGTVHTNLVGNLTGHRWFRLKNGSNSVTFSSVGTHVITAQYPILA